MGGGISRMKGDRSVVVLMAGAAQGCVAVVAFDTPVASPCARRLIICNPARVE